MNVYALWLEQAMHRARQVLCPRNRWGNLPGGASRLAALLLPHIGGICSVVTPCQPGVRSLFDSVTSAAIPVAPPLAELTGETPDLGAHGRTIRTIVDDALRQARAARDELDRRINAVNDALALHDGAPDPAARVEALQAAGRAMFGAGFPMVPTLTLVPTASADFAAATAGSSALVAPLVAAGRDDPAGDWLHGVARVRERVQHWETVVLLADPLRRRCGAPLPGNAALGLLPLQLPHVAGE